MATSKKEVSRLRIILNFLAKLNPVSELTDYDIDKAEQQIKDHFIGLVPEKEKEWNKNLLKQCEYKIKNERIKARNQYRDEILQRMKGG